MKEPLRQASESALPLSAQDGNISPPLDTSQPTEARKLVGFIRQLGPLVFRSVISVLLIAGSLVCFGLLEGSRPTPVRTPTETSLPVVEVLPIVQHVGGIDFDVDGVVIPFQRIEVPTEVAGRIAYRSDNCRIGRTVEQGELLFKIDPQEYQLEVRRLEEQLKQAQANLHELEIETAARKRQIVLAQEDLAIKQREVQRYVNIDDPGVYSKSELDSARLKELQARDAVQTEADQLEMLLAQHGRLESACDLASVQLEKSRLDLSRSEIRSPIAGVITQEPLEQGVYVQRGGTLAVVQDTSCMEIRCSLQMAQMQWLWQSVLPQQIGSESCDAYHIPETPVTVVFEVGTTQYSWKGSLAYFDGAQVDQQTRMVSCRVYVRDPDGVVVDEEVNSNKIKSSPITLMTGMFVTLQIHAKPAISLVELPEVAVQPGNQVWTVRINDESEEQTANLHKVAVRVANTTRGIVLAYADSNLTPGDLIVVSPLASPQENALVQILESR